MLSAETAIGKYPLESIKMMCSIARAIEDDLDPLNFSRYIPKDTVRKSDRRSSICHAAMNISNDLDIKGIAVMTESGSTATRPKSKERERKRQGGEGKRLEYKLSEGERD